MIFAIFYQKIDILKYYVENPYVYARSSLYQPFILEPEDEDQLLEDDLAGGSKFLREKTEVYPLIMCIMLHNKEMFKYLWQQCSYIFNEIHFACLTNFILQAKWADGLKALFGCSASHQIFTQMNTFEKDKFLKYCDRKVSTNYELAEVFRK